MQKTKIQIIEETVEYYSNNERAVLPNGYCVYLTEDGRMCAHSRCLINDDVRKVGTSKIAFDLITSHELGDDIHKEEYRGHEEEFWGHIQRLHDDYEFWSGRKLTERGRNYVEYLRSIYNNQ